MSRFEECRKCGKHTFNEQYDYDGTMYFQCYECNVKDYSNTIEYHFKMTMVLSIFIATAIVLLSMFLILITFNQ